MSDWQEVRILIEEHRQVWKDLCPDWDTSAPPVDPDHDALLWIFHQAIQMGGELSPSYRNIAEAARMAERNGVVSSFSGFISYLNRAMYQAGQLR